MPPAWRPQCAGSGARVGRRRTDGAIVFAWQTKTTPTRRYGFTTLGVIEKSVKSCRSVQKCKKRVFSALGARPPPHLVTQRALRLPPARPKHAQAWAAKGRMCLSHWLHRRSIQTTEHPTLPQQSRWWPRALAPDGRLLGSGIRKLIASAIAWSRPTKALGQQMHPSVHAHPIWLVLSWEVS